MPTIATRVLPSSKTAARTLQGSWNDWWYALPYPPGCSMPIEGEMSRSANPAFKTCLDSGAAPSTGRGNQGQHHGQQACLRRT